MLCRQRALGIFLGVDLLLEIVWADVPFPSGVRGGGACRTRGAILLRKYTVHCMSTIEVGFVFGDVTRRLYTTPKFKK